MKKTLLFVGLACALGFGASVPDASADCQSDCLQDFPNACYNTKSYRWAKGSDNIAHVRVQNFGSFGGAFNWAVDELNDPNVGKTARIQLQVVTTEPDIRVFDDPNICDNDFGGHSSSIGNCGWWGLTHTSRSGNRMTRAKIWLAVDEMNENTAARDLLVRKHTMLHEFGHALGLDHACVNNDHTMWACGMPNRDYTHTPYLTSCDVDGLIHLYGSRP